MKARLASLLVTLVATGCATLTTMENGTPVPAERIYQAELSVPSPGHTATVSFFRDSGFVGAGCTHTVFVDGESVFDIRTGEYQTLYLVPGPHLFAVEMGAGICPDFQTSDYLVLRDGAEETYRIFIPSQDIPVRLARIGASTGRFQPQEAITLPFMLEGEARAWDVGYNTENQVQRIVEFVRAGQTIENWTELITVVTFDRAADLGSVDDQIAMNHSELVARCPGSTVETVRRTPDDVLYESRVVNCQQGADEHLLVRVLDGSRNRFVVQYGVRGAVEMTPERRAEWIEQLTAVEILSEQ